MSKGKLRTDAQKTAQRRRTAKNKINAIKKALFMARGQAIIELEKRLTFWEKQL